ncbi:MAG TPA: hypothetical protein VIU81_03140 [Gaiellaceae bacterium]
MANKTSVKRGSTIIAVVAVAAAIAAGPSTALASSGKTGSGKATTPKQGSIRVEASWVEE